MQAPGKGLLKVVSILFIVAGGFATLSSIVGTAGSAWLSRIGVSSGGMMMAAMISSVIIGVLEILFGILGINRCENPTKGGFFIMTGGILCGLQLLNMVLHSIGIGFVQVFGLLGFILPVLFIVGGVKNKIAAGV